MKTLRVYAALWRELFGLCLRREPRASALVLACMAINAVAFTGIGYALKLTVDAIAAGDAGAAAWAAGLAALTYALDRSITTVGQSMQIQIMEKVGRVDIEPGIMRATAGLDGIGHLERREFLDRVTAVRGKSWAVVNSAWTVAQAASMVLRLGLALIALGIATPWLLVLLPCTVLQMWLDRRGQAALRRAELALADDQRTQRHLFGLCASAAAGKEIRTAGAGPELVRRQDEAWRRVTRRRVRGEGASALWSIAGWAVFAAGYGGAIGVVAYQVRSGGASAGDVMMAATIGALLREVVERAVSTTADATGSVRVLEPYLWLRRYAAVHAARGPAQEAPARLRTGITLEGVGFTYEGTATPALQDVSVELPAGSVVAVVGEYGSGKTTLVKLLSKMYEPSAGTVRVDGVDLERIDTASWREAMSATFQDFGRYETDFDESVRIGDLRRGDADAFEAAIGAADAVELRERLPEGDRTALGTRFGGVSLSEGQWQKVALARSCMRQAPLLFVLDEPTASLDAPSEQAVFGNYIARSRRIAEMSGAITVVVSHRFSTVAGADLVLVMKGGRLIETGSHEELMAADGDYAELFAAHASSYAGS